MINFIHMLNMRYMYKIDRRGGGAKNSPLGNYQVYKMRSLGKNQKLLKIPGAALIINTTLCCDLNRLGYEDASRLFFLL